jgi:hypothetical protein
VIASPLESLPQELRSPESFQGFWTEKKGKKNGAGLFSKLLSGLLKNPGNKISLSGTSPEEAGEDGAPGVKPGKIAGKLFGNLPGDMPGETPGGKPLRKAGGQAFTAGSWFSRTPGEEASGTEEPAGALKKPAGTRKGEEAVENFLLFSRAEVSAGKLRGPEDPGEGSLAPDGEGVESGLWGEESLSQEPEASTVLGGTYFSGSGLDFPNSEETAAGEDRRHRFPQEGLSGLEGKLAGEISRAGEGKPGPGAAGKTEKDEKRPAEARRTERRRERPAVFEAQDLRGGQETGAPGLKEEALPEGKGLSGQEIDLSVELKNENRGSERASTGGEKTLSQAFEDILARELHQNLNGDIVRHASVILRDGGEGLIRLSLKPDSLGNVKIRLEMAENKITGHIVVESDEALRAFEREIGSLEQAFKDSGFESADLNMSLASGDSGADQRREAGEHPFFSERFVAEQAASRYDALTEKRDVLFAMGSANGLKPGNGRISVNLLV